MPKSLIYFLFSLLLFSCGQDDDISDNVIQPVIQEVEDFELVHSYTRDTLQTNTLYPAIGDGERVELATTYYHEDDVYSTTEQKIKSNKSALIHHKTANYYPDSLTPYLADDRTELIAPQEIAISQNSSTLREPAQKRMLPWIYKDATQFDIQNLTSDQGLASNNVNCIFKDSRSMMWFGTDKGLISFDGTFTKNYNLQSGIQDENITAITEDRDGNLWLGSANNSFIKFDGAKFQQFLTDSIRPDQPVTHLYVDDKNEIWGIILFGGIFHFDGSTFYSYREDQGMLSNRPITSIFFNEDGTKWITGFGVGLYKLDENGLGKTKGNSSYLNQGFMDSKSRFWLAGWNSDINYFRGDTMHAFKLDPKYETGLMLDVQEDSKGRIWALSYSEGVFMLDGDEVSHYGTDEGLGYQYQTNMFIDEADVVWLGSNGGGVSRIDPASFSVVNSYSGLNTDQVTGVAENQDGTICYTTAMGIFIQKDSFLIHPEVYHSSTKHTHNLNKPVNDVLFDGEKLWISASNQGVLKYVNDKVTIFGSSMKGGVTNPTSLAKDQKGQVWAGSAIEGLLRFRNDSMWAYRGDNGLAFSTITELFVDQEKNLWVGSESQGLAKIGDDGIIYYSTNEGLISNRIVNITADSESRIWIASEGGLNYIENGEILTVNATNNFFQNPISAILQDKLGQYWISSEYGMIVLIPKAELSEKWDINDYRIEIIDKENGLINEAFLQTALYESSAGHIRAGTKGGLLSWPISTSVLDESVSPVAGIQLITIGNQAIDASLEPNEDISFDASSFKSFQKTPNNLALAYDFNSISIDFNGLYWKDPSRLTFGYFLEGYDEDWCVGGSENRAVYKNLDYGKYTFHLTCKIPDGLESEEVLYEFEVLRPWWHTWIARVLFVGIFTFLIFLLVKARTKKLQQRQTELEHEVKNATSEIQQQKDEIEEAHTEIKDSIAYAKRIQSAILPSLKLVSEYIPNSFILYKPKDVVAGDFYWMEPLADQTLFAAADCTGHGVPGAMVSVICNNALNRAVREFGLTDPGEILDKTREMLIAEFEKSDEDVRDGMDIAICALEPFSETKGTAQLKYAGANNPLWIIRKGATEIEEIKSTKEPIGKYEKLNPFKTHTIELKKGDAFYIFSDGFSDQFGGERGKKFKGSQFKALLVSIQNETMEAQRKAIDDTFESWRGSIEQVDDVCVIGVRI